LNGGQVVHSPKVYLLSKRLYIAMPVNVWKRSGCGEKTLSSL